MSQLGLGLLLAAVVLVIAPGKAVSGQSPNLVLRAAVPNRGDVTVAESRFRIRNIRASLPTLPAGTCQAPLGPVYVGGCFLTNLLPANTFGAFTMTLASPLPPGGEFGFTALIGKTQLGYPIRIVDINGAKTVLARLVAKHPKNDSLTRAQAAHANGNVRQARDLLTSEAFYLLGLNHGDAYKEAADIYAALDDLGCFPR